MDKRQTFQGLEAKYEELLASYAEVKQDWMADFEGTQDYHTYMSYTQDEVKKEMYPEWFEKEQKMNTLKTKVDAFEKEVINSARNLYKELDEKVTKLEEKINVNKDYVKTLDAKITQLNLDIKNLKETEAYQNGDQSTLLQVEELEEELKLKTSRKEKMLTGIKDIESEINKIKLEKEDLVDRYGKEVSIIESQPGENSEPTKEDEDENTKPNKKNPGKGRVVIPNATTDTEELTPEEKAQKEQEEKDKKLKEDFTKLKDKIKKGELSDEDFASLVTIMKDKENYSKLGISTGIVFNKSRGIFKTLNKYAQGNPEKEALVSEAYKTYEGVFHEKHSDKKLAFLSKFLVLDEVENKEKTPALQPAAGPVKKGIAQELGAQVVPPTEKTNEIPPKTNEKGEKEKSI